MGPKSKRMQTGIRSSGREGLYYHLAGLLDTIDYKMPFTQSIMPLCWRIAMVPNTIAEGEGMALVSGKGKRKPQLQKLYDELAECSRRLMAYKECSEIMGKDRNSCSKTDLEATFMRTKEDHMLNGQLKPAYNVQIAVENYFIVHAYGSNDRTDYPTLIPVLEKHRNVFGDMLEAVTADSGYCSKKTCCIRKRRRSGVISNSRTMRNGRHGHIKKISGSITT